MLKTAIIVCAISLAATGSLHAGATIEVEKFSKADLLTALQTASDDTVIEFQGQSKTKAPWRSEFQAESAPSRNKKKPTRRPKAGSTLPSRRCRISKMQPLPCKTRRPRRNSRHSVRSELAQGSPVPQ